jgi:hypothetical protein
MNYCIMTLKSRESLKLELLGWHIEPIVSREYSDYSISPFHVSISRYTVSLETELKEELYKISPEDLDKIEISFNDFNGKTSKILCIESYCFQDIGIDTHPSFYIKFDCDGMEKIDYMKQMVYTEEFTEKEILHSGEYLGYEFEIVSHGRHPCAYVRVSGDKCFYDEYKDLDYDQMPISCHGGLTYKKKEDGFFWVGWDYGHCEDYHKNFIEDGKKWTTEEIYEEVKNIIEQIEKRNIEIQQESEEKSD